MSTAIDTTNFHSEKWRTYIPKPGATEMSFEDLESKMAKHKTPTGHEVFRWPEFQALAKRLMIDLEAPITRLTIVMAVDEAIKITSEFNGLDETQKKE